MAKKSAAGGGSGPQRPNTLTWATLAGLAAVAIVVAGNYQQMKKLESSVNNRLSAMDARIGQVQEQAVAAAKAAAQPQQQRRGPDPDRVYALNASGAPAAGPVGAPVTIFEVSDFQ